MTSPLPRRLAIVTWLAASIASVGLAQQTSVPAPTSAGGMIDVPSEPGVRVRAGFSSATVAAGGGVDLLLDVEAPADTLVHASGDAVKTPPTVEGKDVSLDTNALFDDATRLPSGVSRFTQRVRVAPGATAGPRPVKVHATWILCDRKGCRNGEATFELTLDVTAPPPPLTPGAGAPDAGGKPAAGSTDARPAGGVDWKLPVLGLGALVVVGAVVLKKTRS